MNIKGGREYGGRREVEGGIDWEERGEGKPWLECKNKYVSKKI